MNEAVPERRYSTCEFEGSSVIHVIVAEEVVMEEAMIPEITGEVVSEGGVGGGAAIPLCTAPASGFVPEKYPGFIPGNALFAAQVVDKSMPAPLAVLPDVEFKSHVGTNGSQILVSR